MGLDHLQFLRGSDSDNTGSSVTSATNPGGYQIGYGKLAATTAGQKFDKGVSETGLAEAKRVISTRDVAVVLAQTDVTGDAGYNLTFKQEW